MNLRQVVSRRLRLKWQLQVKLLPYGRVHDAAREDVRKAAIITRAPNERTNKRSEFSENIIDEQDQII